MSLIERKEQMKKLFCVLLSLTMIFALCACGGGDEKVSDAPEKEVAADAPVEEKAEQTPADEEAETPAADEKEEVKPFSLGVVEGNTYESQYLGIGCTVPENWAIMSADELQELGDMVDELLEGTDYTGVPTIQDMYAIDNETGVNANIVLTQMGEIERVAMKHMSEEEIVENTLKTKDNMIAAYEQMGMDVTSMEGSVIEFLGEEHHVLKTVYTTNGMEAIIIQIFNFNAGGEYGGTITFTAYTEEEAAEIASMFYALA